MKDQCYEFLKNQIGKTNIVGFGSYGQVKIARNTQNNQIVAIKLIHGKNAKQQIDVHHKLNHPNIIKLLNYYYEKQKNISYMVLEYAQNGSLNQKIKFGLGQLSKQLIRKYFKDICEAIKYLHSHNYMHRDIKPENILLTKDNVAKLCDFGFAAIFQARTTMCGTFEYMAPQMIQKKHYNYKIDIWALGILLFQMTQGIAPFRGQSGAEVIGQMKKPIKFSQRFESLQIDLIKKILRVNAQNRPTVQQIIDHPYLKPLKQQQQMNLPKNTTQAEPKLFKNQKTQLPKQKLTSSRQQFTKFLKNSNQNTFKNVQQNIKQKSPFRNNNMKTQPLLNNHFRGDYLSKSFKYKNLNNEESDNLKFHQSRKYSNKFYSPLSSQTQKNIMYPSNNRNQSKTQKNNESINNIRTHKMLPFYTNLPSNNKASVIGTMNFNVSKKDEILSERKLSITVKLQKQKPNQSNLNAGSSTLSHKNRSFKDIKPLYEKKQLNLKTNLTHQEGYRYENIPLGSTSGNNSQQEIVGVVQNINYSHKYPVTKRLQNEYKSPNDSLYSNNQNPERQNNIRNGETEGPLNQKFNLQKNVQIISSSSQNNHKEK